MRPGVPHLHIAVLQEGLALENDAEKVKEWLELIVNH